MLYTTYERRYAKDLLKSFAALQKDTSVRLERPPEMTSLLEDHLVGSEREVADTYQSIHSQLQSGVHTLVRTTQMLPRLSPHFHSVALSERHSCYSPPRLEKLICVVRALRYSPSACRTPPSSC